jgi:thiamine biosynthesis lipoprotein
MPQLAASKNKHKHNCAIEFDAIGTSWRIELYSNSSEAAIDELKRTILFRIEEFDSIYSRFRSDSLVTKISQKAGTYKFPSDSNELFNFYKDLYDETSGRFTPLIGATLEQAGYNADYSFKQTEIDIVPKWHEAMSFKNYTLTTMRPVTLDFGAAGKGYLVDIVSSILSDHGIGIYCVNASGDIYYKTNTDTKLEVALEDPSDFKLAIGTALLKNSSICGSATNRRKWGDYNHIFDPETNTSVNVVSACWVSADKAIVADGLATASFLSSPETLRKKYDFSYVRLMSDGLAEVSDNFDGNLF